MPRGPIFMPNLMKPLRASRLRSSLRPSCRQHSRSRHPISVPFVSENRCWNYYAAVGGVSGRVSPGGMGRVSTRHAGSRIGGNTQTQTRTEIIDSGVRDADDACGMPLPTRHPVSSTISLRPPVWDGLFFVRLATCPTILPRDDYVRCDPGQARADAGCEVSIANECSSRRPRRRSGLA